jgi:hypothetical protein
VTSFVEHPRQVTWAGFPGVAEQSALLILKVRRRPFKQSYDDINLSGFSALPLPMMPVQKNRPDSHRFFHLKTDR